MSGRAKRPLNKAAVKKADAEFYAKHPELKGKPLSANDPKQAALRREWMDLYVKHGGKVENSKGKSAKKCGGTTTGCSLLNNPPYEPDRWNKDSKVKNSTNCYAYAANDPDKHPPGKPQPGQQCGSPLTGTEFFKDGCKSVGAAAKCDGMIPAPNPPTPKPGYYPVALVVAPGKDYHWYRQDNNGRWSHKPGNTAVTDLDASGKQITNPETCDRNYGRVNYSKFCGYYYVPASGIRTGPP
jgi:hypothetical protein